MQWTKNGISVGVKVSVKCKLGHITASFDDSNILKSFMTTFKWIYTTYPTIFGIYTESITFATFGHPLSAGQNISSQSNYRISIYNIDCIEFTMLILCLTGIERFDVTVLEQLIYINILILQLMSKMAPLLGKEMTDRVFLNRFCEMCTDPLFHVRKVCFYMVNLEDRAI
jgi:hypothetical protein